MQKKPTHLRALNIVSIVVFALYLLVLSSELTQLLSSTPAPITLSVLPLAALVGYLLADFLSGFVHFLGDTFGSPSTPIIGPAFIFPFREHHVEPQAITHHDFIETNGHNCLVSIPVMMMMAHGFFHVALRSQTAAFFFATGYFLILGVFATNQFHKWAHMKKAPRFVTLLQGCCLILSPTHHKIHHTSPYTRYFCITTGWLNLLLDRARFFPAAKAVIRRMPFMLKTVEEYKHL